MAKKGRKSFFRFLKIPNKEFCLCGSRSNINIAKWIRHFRSINMRSVSRSVANILFSFVCTERGIRNILDQRCCCFCLAKISLAQVPKLLQLYFIHYYSLEEIYRRKFSPSAICLIICFIIIFRFSKKYNFLFYRRVNVWEWFIVIIVHWLLYVTLRKPTNINAFEFMMLRLLFYSRTTCKCRPNARKFNGLCKMHFLDGLLSISFVYSIVCNKMMQIPTY